VNRSRTGLWGDRLGNHRLYPEGIGVPLLHQCRGLQPIIFYEEITSVLADDRMLTVDYSMISCFTIQ